MLSKIYDEAFLRKIVNSLLSANPTKWLNTLQEFVGC